MSTGTLTDSNVLLDVMTRDTTWCDWSERALTDAAEAGPLWINPLIYAEVSVRFSRIEELDDALPSGHVRRADLPWAAAFLAGKAFRKHRQRRSAHAQRDGAGVGQGPSRTARPAASVMSEDRSSTLPDFCIGAHAAVSDFALLTRDASRYRTYFPTVRLIAPPCVSG